ncbi:MAG: hypothetical protein A3F11_06820 [Gammaproteobacteria bacterium RIFCSPHIGHO2_12_FULL_37_14]|nr:MAG: hypothetical protein A3F11_06820 [Gammaproteobacteria bacterium RIFCSPHIGHO2_12_FULL_37_14]
MFKGIDLSSDTATKPSLAMKKFMFDAEVGDEQKDEDPTTIQLEKIAAKLFNFEAAIFLPSATMANEIAICTLSNPGEVLLGAENCHLFLAECGGPAVHAQVVCRSIHTPTGIFTPDDIKQQNYWARGTHHPTVSVLSIENTTNFGGGYAWSKEELSAVMGCAKEFKIKTHLDGSRVFNASIKTNLSTQEIAQEFDMVTICLSKGLGCPIGALLLFNRIHYQNVRRLKKLMGGAMRQSGILAAAGIYALQHNITRLATDHKHAGLFAKEIDKLPAKIHLINNPPATNIVFFEWKAKNTSTTEFLNQCTKNGVRFSQVGKNKLRAMMHLDISYHDVVRAVEIVKNICMQY